MLKLIVASIITLSATIAFADAAKKEDTPPVTAQKKPDVKKPCKDGQDPEKDKCHVVNKVDKKK